MIEDIQNLPNISFIEHPIVELVLCLDNILKK